MRKLLDSLRRLPASLLWDVLVVAGVLLLTAGLGLAWGPLALITPGCACLIFGIMGARVS